MLSDLNRIKLEMNSRKTSEQSLLISGNFQRHLQIIHRKVLKETKILEPKWKQNTVYQNMWDIAEAVLRRKFIAKFIVNFILSITKLMSITLVCLPQELEKK